MCRRRTRDAYEFLLAGSGGLPGLSEAAMTYGGRGRYVSPIPHKATMNRPLTAGISGEPTSVGNSSSVASVKSS